MIRVGGFVGKTEKMGASLRGCRPRVLYYSHSGDISGAEISLLLTISSMHDVEAVLVAPKGELLERAKQLNMNIIQANSYRARMTRNPILLLKGICGTLTAGIELRRIIHRYRPDIVHANSIRAGLIALVGTVKSSPRLVWHVRDNLSKNLVGRAIRLVAERYVNEVFTISDAIRKDFAISLGLQRKTRVVHNGIEVRPPQGASIRSEVNTPDSRYVIGVVGQIAPWKRQHDAIEAFADFHRRVPNSELWVVGEPKFREENVLYASRLRQMANELGVADSVHFLGFRTDIMNVMTSIDVLLVPSENEPFGRVVIEAMLAGKPVIGTNGGGIPEIVVDEVTGYLVNMGDSSSMNKYLSKLHSDKSLARRLGTQGRYRVENVFSIRNTTKQIRQTYENLLRKYRPEEGHGEAQTYRISSQ